MDYYSTLIFWMSQRRKVTHLLQATQIGSGRAGIGAGQSDSRVCARASDSEHVEAALEAGALEAGPPASGSRVQLGRRTSGEMG